jgi:hypothetical protein
MRTKINAASNPYRSGDPPLAAREEVQSYCLAHPGSPSAVRRPQLSSRGDPLDCTSWPECGERDRWDWTERGGGTPRFRYAILRLSRVDDARDENARFNLFALVAA